VKDVYKQVIACFPAMNKGCFFFLTSGLFCIVPFYNNLIWFLNGRTAIFMVFERSLALVEIKI
jgi:hypothetical protein